MFKGLVDKLKFNFFCKVNKHGICLIATFAEWRVCLLFQKDISMLNGAR